MWMVNGAHDLCVLFGSLYIYIYFPVYICINFAVMHRIEGKVGSLAFCECSAICRRTSKKSAFSARGCADPVRCLSPIDSWCWSGGFNGWFGDFMLRNPPIETTIWQWYGIPSIPSIPKFPVSGFRDCIMLASCSVHLANSGWFPSTSSCLKALNRVFVTQNLWHKQKGTLHFRCKL